MTMERERILLVRKPGYDRTIQTYQELFKRFKALVEGMKQCGIEPTLKTVKSLLRGEDLSYLMAEKNVEKSFSTLPKAMMNAIASMFQKENKEMYETYVKEKAGKLIQMIHNNPVDLSYFSFVNGEVILSPEHITHAEKRYCIFVDSPGKFQVYDAWQEFVKAKQHLDEVVKAAAKRPSNPTEQHIRLFGKDLIGVAAPGNFSIGKILYDGELVMNEENFDWFQ